MEVMNLKDFRKQIKGDNKFRKLREMTKASIIAIIEAETFKHDDSKVLDILNGLMQTIKDLV